MSDAMRCVAVAVCGVELRVSIFILNFLKSIAVFLAVSPWLQEFSMRGGQLFIMEVFSFTVMIVYCRKCTCLAISI